MLAHMTRIFSPSEAAQQSGFSLDTLRYYERIGLLDGISRAPSGHRRFGDDDLEWLGVLRCLRDTGMPIAQMHRYAALARAGEPTMAERLRLLTEHDAQVCERIALLQAQRQHLHEKIDWYRSQLPAGDHS
jgi:DNA-binding transcriptional MerR regulator